MTVIENSVIVNRSAERVYAFLADCNNHEALMPDSIYNWSSTYDEARFTIQNMAKLALKVDRRDENKEVVLIPSEEAPFDVTLRWVLTGEATTKATLLIEADLNMMMKMLASGPLQKLVDYQVAKLAEILA